MSTTPKSKEYKKWESYLHDDKLSKHEKVNLIQENVKMIEEKAMRKEELLEQSAVPGGIYGYDYQNNEVNDLLIDAIKAKLAMLDEIK